VKKEIEVKTQAELEKACADGNIAVVRAGVFTAYGSSQVTAYGSSQVTACGSSQVTACGSSQVTACDSSQVTASKQVAVTVTGKAKVTGGVQIKYKGPRTAKHWLANYGVVPEKGVAILYKIVRADWKSQHGTSYEPGTMPKADDWDGGTAECGGGLHFCPIPCMCYQFDAEGKKFVACPVKVSEIVVHKDPNYPTKIKAPRVCAPTWEVDVNGKKIEAKK